MKYLLDTHTFVWWSISSHVLPSSVFTILEDTNNTIFLSVVSIWEMQIKIQTGKLSFPEPLPEVIMKQHRQNGFRFFSITLKHIYGIANLPFHHRDPFDRLLISQAITAKIPLITRDSDIARYPVPIIW